MTDPVPDRIAEVLRLTSVLTDQVLDAQATSRPVPEDQHRALIMAADLLREHGVAPPPMLEQALHGLTDEPCNETARAEKRSGASDDLGIFEEIARALTGMRKG